MGAGAGFVQGLYKTVGKRLEEQQQAKEEQAREKRLWLLKVSMTPNLPDSVQEDLAKLLKQSGYGKESMLGLQRVWGVLKKAGKGPPQNAQAPPENAESGQFGGAPQRGPIGPPGKMGQPDEAHRMVSVNQAAAKAEGEGQEKRSESAIQGREAVARTQAQSREDVARIKAESDKAVAKTRAELTAQAKKDLEDLQAKHKKELQDAKDADAKTLADVKAKHAKEIEQQHSDNAKKLFEAKDVAKAKKAVGSGESMTEAVAKKYVPGGPSIANPTSDGAVEVGAWDWIFTDHLPFTGFGGGGKKGGKNAREMMLGRANEILADLNLEPRDLPSLRANLKGNSAAFAKVTSMGAMVRQFENTLEANMKTAQKLSDAWTRSDFQFVNRVLGAFKTGTGSPEALNLAGQLHGVAREWGKIMAGSTSAAGVPVSEANSSDLLISKGITNGQLASFMQNVIVPDIHNRTAAIRKEQDELLKEIRGSTGGTPSPGKGGPVAPPNGGGPKVVTKAQFDALPPGATYIGKDGETYQKPKQ